MIILGENKKLSYEGEGVRLGLKTLFFAYPGKGKIKEEDVLGIYITTSQFDDKLYTYLKLSAKKGKLITIETEATNKIPSKFKKIKNILIFKSITSYVPVSKVRADEFIKVRVKESNDLNRLISIANSYCLDKNNWNKVLLMPEYRDNFSEVLKDNFSKIHKGVRFMPPVQTILNID